MFYQNLPNISIMERKLWIFLWRRKRILSNSTLIKFWKIFMKILQIFLYERKVQDFFCREEKKIYSNSTLIKLKRFSWLSSKYFYYEQKVEDIYVEREKDSFTFDFDKNVFMMIFKYFYNGRKFEDIFVEKIPPW